MVERFCSSVSNLLGENNASKLTSVRVGVIGVGGVGSAFDVYNKIKLGASLVQMYTSLTYGGPQLINKILIDLVKLIKDDGFANISEAVGVNNK